MALTARKGYVDTLVSINASTLNALFYSFHPCQQSLAGCPVESIPGCEANPFCARVAKPLARSYRGICTQNCRRVPLYTVGIVVLEWKCPCVEQQEPVGEGAVRTSVAPRARESFWIVWVSTNTGPTTCQECQASSLSERRSIWDKAFDFGNWTAELVSKQRMH